MSYFSRLRGVGWLVVKDMQILRRSPMMLALLVIYPIVVAILIGFALSRGPEKPRVAFLNEVTSSNSDFLLGGKRIDTLKYTRDLFEAIDPIIVNSRKEAIQKVKSGEALGAIVVPGNLPQKLQSQLEQPMLDIYVNEEDPVKRRLVDDTINAQLARANIALSRSFAELGISYADLLLRGGVVNFLGQSVKVLGLRPSEKILRRVEESLPRGSPDRQRLEMVIKFASFAGKNFDLSSDALAVIGEPIRAKKHVVSGKTPSLTTFAAALSIGVSLVFVTVILGAAAMALEREEGAFTRLVQSPISYSGLIVAKIALALACSLVLSLLLLLVLELFVSLDWKRFPLWLAALVTASAAHASLGVAVGGIAREVRTATLAAIMLAVPVMFLALVPSGAVTGFLNDTVEVVSAAFPFKATLDALNRALYGAGPELSKSVIHLLALALVYGAIGGLSLRRFARL